MKKLEDKTATAFSKRKRTRIGTWNVRTLYQTGKLAQVAAEANRLNVSIMGLSETRWTEFGEHVLASKQVLLYSGIRGTNAPHEKGVGFLLSPNAHKSLMEWQPVNERIIVARFNAPFRNVTIIQCYAPTENATTDAKETFYDQLTSVIAKVHKKDILIQIGDMNAQIGSDNSELKSVMGRQALGTMTENGEMYTNFCLMHELVIGGSLFQHKKSHKVTWVSPDGITENQIDHISICKRFKSSLLDVRNLRSADVGSDHHLLIGSLRIRIARVKPRRERINSRFDTMKLNDPDIKAAFVAELRSNLAMTQLEHADIESQWASVKNAFLNTSSSVLGKNVYERKEWITDETWKTIESRRDAKAAINTAKTRAAKKRATERWSLLQNQVKKLCKRDKQRWVNNLADEAEQAARVNNTRRLYEITRKLSGKRARTGIPVKDKSGQLITQEEEQMKRWVEHFTELFEIPSDSLTTDFENTPRITRVQRINSNTPSIEEIELAIRSMKNNKAPGIDQITSEMLKADSRTAAQALHPIFSKLWEDEQLPEDWLQGILIKVPKKGDPSICDNYRGIMLLCIPVKILCKVLLNRFEKKVNETLRNTQAGFRAGRSCTEHINTLRIIIEQINELQDSLHLVFIDFKKAFDNLHHNNIWTAMQRKGIPTKLLNIIKAQYTSFKCRILHNGSLSEPIPCKSGVRQGCVLSPLLFLMVLDEVLTTTLDGKKLGIQWSLRSNDHLEELAYADDIALLSTRQADMQEKLIALQNNAKIVGLNINISKTKSMAIGTQAATFFIEENPIESVNSFTYLGSEITTDGGAREDVKIRIRKAQVAFSQLSNIWRSNQLSLSTKLHVFNTCVKSVLLYGCETWLVANDVTRKLQVFINRCLRRICKIFWPNTISNHDLHQKCLQEPIDIEIRRRKWGWIGHTLRRDVSTVSRQALDWNPQGNRRRGNPRRTWRRSLESEIRQLDTNYTWRRVKAMAQDRRLWKENIIALCNL
jgi:hypothetical protein